MAVLAFLEQLDIDVEFRWPARATSERVKPDGVVSLSRAPGRDAKQGPPFKLGEATVGGARLPEMSILIPYDSNALPLGWKETLREFVADVGDGSALEKLRSARKLKRPKHKDAGSKIGEVFVSYARSDHGFVADLVKALSAVGITAWFDADLVHGSQWRDELEQRIRSCGAFVIVMSNASKSSHWCGEELEFARRLGKRIFPVLLEGDEHWFGLQSVHLEDVRASKKPSQSWIANLANALG